MSSKPSTIQKLFAIHAGARCPRLTAGRVETFKDRVDQLELLFGKLSLKEADKLVATLSGSDASTAAPEQFPEIKIILKSVLKKSFLYYLEGIRCNQRKK